MNTGLFATSIYSQRTTWVGVGHDADNDFAGRYHGLYMSYARKTGYGGKGSLPRGARVFEITKEDGAFMHGSSYVINDNGEKNVDMDARSPPTFQFSHQKECSTSVFKDFLLFPEHPEGNNGPDDSGDWGENFISTDNFIQ